MTIASGTCGDNLTWTLNDDYSLVITGSGAMNNYTSSSSGRAPWYSYRTQMTSLTLPEGLTSIGNYAFQICTGFTGTLTIPSSVTSIGIYAFNSCYHFTGPLTIPSSVTSIGMYAFQGCYGFTGTLTIPSSVTSIGTYAFFGCSGFTGSLTIPSSVTSIESYTFRNCSGFTGSLTIPSSVTSIGGSAFRGCYGLTSLTIPSSVTSIGSYAFQNCPGTTEVILQQSTAPTMGTNCFALGISSKTVTATVKSTDNWASSVLDSYKDEYTTLVYKTFKIGATIEIKVSGSWVEGTPSVKVGNSWVPAKAVYTRVNGVWQPTPPPRYGFAAVDIAIATSDPSTRCTYPQTITVNGETVNNSCYGFTPMAGTSNGTFTNGSWADHELLKNIIPVVSDKGSTPSFSKASTNASSWTNSSEYFTEFPFNWLSITKDSTKVRIIFSDNDAQPDNTFQCFAHAKGCDSYTNDQIESAMPSLSRETILTSNNNSYFANAFHVGCFLASGSTSAIYSNKNGTPLVSTAYTNYWKAANARGTDYDCFSFQQLTYIQALFVLLFRSTNSQASHSAGYSTGNAVPTTGAGLSTNTFGMAGTIGGGTTRNAFLWIHDPWGSINQYIGGLWLRGDGTRNMYYWLPRQANSRAFNNGWTGATTASTQASLGTSTGTTGSNAWHFIKEVAGSKYAGFYPTVQSGATATTYFCDIGYTESSSSNANFPTIGGFFNSDTYNGIFYVETNRASTFAHASWTTRLAYRGGY